MRKRENKWLGILFLLGFLVGVIGRNLWYKSNHTTFNLFEWSRLQTYAGTEVIPEKLMWYVIKERLLLVIGMGAFNLVKKKKMLVYGILSFFGTVSGVMIVSAVISLGMKGLLVYAAGLIPQGVCYLFALLIVLLYWNGYPYQKWNPTKTLVVSVLILVGIILEIYVNPIVLKWVISIL